MSSHRDITSELSLAVAHVDPNTLIPHANNARTHSDRQISKIARSITRFGFVNPILTDAASGVIAGHGRVLAAKQLGLASVPVIALDHLSDAQKRAYILADNRLAEEAGWDRDLLRLELGALIELDDAIEITDTGFEIAEIDTLLLEVEPPDPDDDAPQPDAWPPIATRGDVWLFDEGRHRLLCGDALEAGDVDRLVSGEPVRLMLTDPPYNVKVQGHVSGLGKAKHTEFAFASGEMDAKAFTAFLTTSLTNGAEHLVDGGLAYVFMDWRHMAELLGAGAAAFDEMKNVCVWAKNNGGMGSLYRSAHELCFIFKSGQASHVNNVELGRHGRNRTNVWTFAGANSFSATRAKDLADHPTVKPVGMLAEAILDVTRPGEIVLDLFGGSGSTLMAAERARRRGFLIEYEPKYVDVTLRRWIERYGSQPVLEATGEPFSAVEATRAQGAPNADADAAPEAPASGEAG